MSAPRVHAAIPGWEYHDDVVAAMLEHPDMVAALAERAASSAAAAVGSCTVTVTFGDGRVVTASGRECDLVWWAETEDITPPDDQWRRLRPVATHLRVQLANVMREGAT